MPNTTKPEHVDHLVYVVPILEAGCDAIEQLLGVRPALGGRHPRFGTHNALLSLGAETYLELIARDPGLEVPAHRVLFGAASVSEPRLVTWALRSESIDETAAIASAAGIGLGAIVAGSRRRPDGESISWRFSDPNAMPLTGAVPFLISWGDTLHPAAGVPRAGELVGLRLEHPEPERVRKALATLGVEMDVSEGNSFRLIARIETAHGAVEIS